MKNISIWCLINQVTGHAKDEARMAEVSLAAISQGKLPETVEECHQVIKDLFYIIEQLQLQINELREENKLLKERLNLNSKNSSKPPSSDHKKSKK